MTARVALANLPFPSSIDTAIATAIQAIQEASESGASIVCFPECYLPGYSVEPDESSAVNQSVLEDEWTIIADAAQIARITVVLPTERYVGAGLRISALVIDQHGKLLGFQDKVQLDPTEERKFQPGTERRLFQAGELTFGIAICHEAFRYPETVRWSAVRGAHLVFQPHYIGPEAGLPGFTTFADPRNTIHEKAMICRAAENSIYFAAVNYATEASSTTSCFIGPSGEVLSYQPYGKSGLLIQDLELEKATGFLASRFKGK